MKARSYVDTSVLVKRYVAEPASNQARSLLRKRRVVTSAMTPVEAISAFHRRQAEGSLSGERLGAILGRIAADRLGWELLEVNQPILDRAEVIVARTRARTLDAIHIASVLCINDATRANLDLVTADRPQFDAALLMGLRAIFVG